jgi:hypothetical protein
LCAVTGQPIYRPQTIDPCKHAMFYYFGTSSTGICRAPVLGNVHASGAQRSERRGVGPRWASTSRDFRKHRLFDGSAGCQRGQRADTGHVRRPLLCAGSSQDAGWGDEHPALRHAAHPCAQESSGGESSRSLNASLARRKSPPCWSISPGTTAARRAFHLRSPATK